MRKRAILALMLVLALAVTTSCSLIVKDAEVDKQTVIIDVAGQTFTKGEVAAQVAQTLDYQEYVYTMYGMAYDKTDPTVISSARDTVIDALVEQAVLNQKKDEMGLGDFTQEELAELKASVEETYQGYIDGVKASYFADTELSGEELDKAVAEKLTELAYPSKEELLESEKENKATEKLKAEVVKGVTVADDEVKAEYDTRVESAKTEYAGNLSAYGTAVQNGSTVYYTPAGYRYVKNILRKLSEEDSQKISDLNSQITAKQTQLDNIQSSLTDLGEDAGADDEETAKSRAELTEAKAKAEGELADLQKQLDEAKEAAYANVQPTIDEILAKLEAGGDFDALMEEYGEDTGMQASPAKETGYPVCEGSTTWVAEFTEAAMALEKIGDVSPAVRTSYGIHILQYAGDAAEGAADYDGVKETVRADLLTQKQDALYNETVDRWVTEANAKIYKDRLAD